MLIHLGDFMQQITEKLNAKGLRLPPPPQALAAYEPALRVLDSIYVSGQLAFDDFKGVVPSSISPEKAIKAAETAFLNALSLAISLLNPEEKLQLIQVQGFVQCESDFKEIPQIINGASLLAIELLGDQGKHTRFAVGVTSLPKNSPVEVACTFKVYL